MPFDGNAQGEGAISRCFRFVGQAFQPDGHQTEVRLESLTYVKWRIQVIHKPLGILLVAFAFTALNLAASAGSSKSESKVKASASATKINDKGEQTVTISLIVEKGWHIYANPVNHNNDFLDAARTKVKIEAKSKFNSINVAYPPGTTHMDGKEKYDIYKGNVKLEATLKRAAGDTSPLQITIEVQACDSIVCLEPSKVKLVVP
jgi:DsbC/DsbD-like thiol-disulfide interchange protein